MSTPIALTDDNFSEEVLDSNVPVLVDFWTLPPGADPAEWLLQS